MRASSRLYLLFALLGVSVAVLLMLLYRFIPAETASPDPITSVEIPADLEAVLKEARSRDGWIYQMQLHQKQNIFSYPRTVYHINLN